MTPAIRSSDVTVAARRSVAVKGSRVFSAGLCAALRPCTDILVGSGISRLARRTHQGSFTGYIPVVCIRGTPSLHFSDVRCITCGWPGSSLRASVAIRGFATTGQLAYSQLSRCSILRALPLVAVM